MTAWGSRGCVHPWDLPFCKDLPIWRLSMARGFLPKQVRDGWDTSAEGCKWVGDCEVPRHSQPQHPGSQAPSAIGSWAWRRAPEATDAHLAAWCARRLGL